MSRFNVRTFFTIGVTAAALAGAGCGSSRDTSNLRLAGTGADGGGQSAALGVPGVQRTATAVDGLRQVNQELANARGAVDESIAALAELSAARGDLLAPFQRFLTANQQVDDAERHMGERGEQMRARARDYITNWEVEVYGVEDPDLRKQAESRRSRVRADYGRIADASRAFREEMAPFQKSLDDLETFLGNDLTPAGVRAAAAAIERATQQGQALQQRIDALSSELDRVAAAMTPAVPVDASGAPAGSSDAER